MMIGGMQKKRNKKTLAPLKKRGQIDPGGDLHSPVASTIGAGGLSYCVRNGNRRDPSATATRKKIGDAEYIKRIAGDVR